MGNARIQFRRGTAAYWDSENPVLFPGEPGLETDTRRLKIGDGITHWRELEYSPAIVDVEDPGGETPVDLAGHINDLTPHPVYDEGPSLALLYQNGKV